MPNLDNIPVPLYQPEDPYHYEYDNKPIEGLIERVARVNDAVDINSNILRGSIGSAGTLSNRLAQSLEDSGELKVEAVDSVMHHIANHTDGDGYVRMTDDERDKLSLIASEATNLVIDIEVISNTVTIDEGVLTFAPSDSVTWRYTNSKLYADMAFPVEAAHEHHYDITPVAQNLITPDYKNYKTTSVNTPYVSGSLRVYVNGVRVPKDPDEVYIPGSTPSESWVQNSVVEDDPDVGEFSLTTAITSSDLIKIDFDQSLV